MDVMMILYHHDGEEASDGKWEGLDSMKAMIRTKLTIIPPVMEHSFLTLEAGASESSARASSSTSITSVVTVNSRPW
jgi:hypothetical protein